MPFDTFSRTFRGMQDQGVGPRPMRPDADEFGAPSHQFNPQLLRLMRSPQQQQVGPPPMPPARWMSDLGLGGGLQGMPEAPPGWHSQVYPGQPTYQTPGVGKEPPIFDKAGKPIDPQSPYFKDASQLGERAFPPSPPPQMQQQGGFDFASELAGIGAPPQRTPLPQRPQYSTFSQVLPTMLGGIGDALAAYGGARPTNFMGQATGLQERMQDRDYQDRLAQAAQEDESNQAAWKFRLMLLQMRQAERARQQQQALAERGMDIRAIQPQILQDLYQKGQLNQAVLGGGQ